MSTEFDAAMELTERAGEPGTYDGALGAGWRIGNGVNGGVLIGLAATALSRTFGEPDGDRPAHPYPRSVSAHYLSPGVPGPATVHTETVRRGRSVSTGAATLTQPGEHGEVQRIRILGTYATMDGPPGDTAGEPFAMPPPEECAGRAEAPSGFFASSDLLERVDVRIDPATAGFAVGRPSGQGEVRAWLRMADGHEPDPFLLLLAVDALPPVAFDLGFQGWTPTLELTAHVRGLPAPGWLRIRVNSRTRGGQFMEEDAEVWDSAGRLVAISRQLAMFSRQR